jgi:hypothetical protein
LQHPPEVLVLGRETDLVIDAGGPAAVPVISPGGREVELAVDQCTSPGRGVGQEGSDLAVLGSPGGAGVLSLHSGRLCALLKKAGVVADQDAIRAADGLHDEVTDVVADRVLVPVGVVEQALDPVRAELSDLLGQRPAVLLLQRSDEPLEVVQRPLARLGPAETVSKPGMQPGYPFRPRLNLFNRQLVSTQSHQRRPRLIVTPDAVAVLGRVSGRDQ